MSNQGVLSGLEMAMDIRFNRKLNEKDYVIPGGYEMVFAGKSISFDFMDYCGSFDRSDPTILHCEMEHPDFDSFEEFSGVTESDLHNIEEITECYVYIGEECAPELHEVEILAITFWPAEGDSIDVSNEVIRNYNRKLKG